MATICIMKILRLILVLLVVTIFQVKGKNGFITIKGVNFMLDGNLFYANGFNAYWLMYEASFIDKRQNISHTFEVAKNNSLTIARIWAFSDGEPHKALQYSPGSYNEEMFQALDFVVNEAKKHGIKLILSLVNNWIDYGGKIKYVKWGNQTGNLRSSDDFFTDYVVKGFYKDHIKSVLTRVNSINGVAYKDDPTIMAWELMNEPRCMADLSGQTLQSWISEMATYLKSIDTNHLLEIGYEGFYGPSTPEKIAINPQNDHVGTDFIAHNQIPGVDFATVHTYSWLGKGHAPWESQLAFMTQWVNHHIEDSQNILRKPVIFAEWGKNYKDADYSEDYRIQMYNMIYGAIYASANKGGCAAGGLFWQLMMNGMDNMRDGLEIVLTDKSTTVAVISEESRKLAKLCRQEVMKLRE